MSDMMTDTLQADIIPALLPNVPFDGWTTRALRSSMVSLGRPPEDAVLLFPGGAAEMIEAYCAWADQDMINAALAADLAAFRLTARVRAIVALRFERNRDNKEAIRRALAILSLPQNAPLAAKLTARTVDAIWFAAGDRSADFAWYTKRAILAAAYTATLLYWLTDTSDDDIETMQVFDRRLAGIARIGKIRRGIKKRMPSFRPSFKHPDPSPSA
jgi:ubiquinone biosynthesis protein COQ9